MCKQSPKELTQIYREVKQDIESRKEELKWIHTTEDFFIWRDSIKKENKENSIKRNEIVEKEVNGNKTLELLYDWTKFYRIMDTANARVFLLKEEINKKREQKEEIEKINFSSTCPLYHYLSKYADIDKNGLFAMANREEFRCRYNEFPPFHTVYEFLKMMTHEEIYGPFAIDILICLLRACHITGEDLILCARQTEEESKVLVQRLLQEETKEKTYRKIG